MNELKSYKKKVWIDAKMDVTMKKIINIISGDILIIFL